MYYFYLVYIFFFSSFCYAMDNEPNPIKNDSMQTINKKSIRRLSSKSNYRIKEKPQLKRLNTISEFSPLNDFKHLIRLIENNDTIFTPRHVTPIITKMKDQSGHTALHKAACYDNPGLIKSLILKGTNPNEKDNDGNTALHLATLHGHHNFIRTMFRLWNKTPDINAQNNKGETALHIATCNGDVKGIKLLLIAHADPTIKNNEGETPKDIARKVSKEFPQLKNISFKQKTLNSQIKNQAKLANEFRNLLIAIQENKIKKIKEYLKNIPIDYSDNSGNTALHIAILFKQINVIHFLLKKGADPNQTNNLGENALHKLFSNGPLELNKKARKQIISIIKLLLRYKVNLNAKTNIDITVLRLAKIADNKKIIAFLESEIGQHETKLSNSSSNIK